MDMSRSPSPEFPFTARASFPRTSGAFALRSHLCGHRTLNSCLLTIFSKIESSECFAKKVTIFHYIVNNFANRPFKLKIVGTPVTFSLENVHTYFFPTTLRFRVRNPYGQTDGQTGKTRIAACQDGCIIDIKFSE